MTKLLPMLTLSMAVIFAASTTTWADDQAAPATPAADNGTAQTSGTPAPSKPEKKMVHKKKHHKKHKMTSKAKEKAPVPAASPAPSGDASPMDDGSAKK
jgi:hypothetical protein